MVKLIGFLGAAVIALGCAAQPAPAPRIPGMTALRVLNDVGDSFELGSLTLVVDGEPVPVAAIPPHGSLSGATTTLRLAPGHHTVAARAVATSTAREERIVVGTQQSFRTGDEPARITVRVYTRAPRTEQLDERVAVDVRVDKTGDPAEPAEPTAREAAADPCAEKAPVDRSICRGVVELDRATRAHDVLRTLCVRDRLSEMRRLAEMRGGVAGREIAGMVERKVGALAQQVDACVAASSVEDGFEPPPLAPRPEGQARPASTSARR